MTQRQLLGNRFDDHDWIKIANIDFDGSRKAEDIKNLWQNSEHPSISKAQWSNAEVERLIEIAERKGCVDWEWIASELQTNRTAFMCLQKYQEFNKELRKKEWTEEEDHMLTELVQKMRVGSFIPYTKIAYFMEGRNSSQLLYRWSKTLDPTVKRGPWTPAEDRLLLKAVAKYGGRDWFKIQEEVPGRLDSQCRGRFRNALNNEVRKGKWSSEEEKDFRALVEKHGVGKWSKIAAELVGRTEMQCISKWRAISGLRAKKRAEIKLRKKSKKKQRFRRKQWESSSESSEFSSEELLLVESEEEEGEEEEEEEDLERAREVERKKRRVRRWNPAESIVLDVNRWVPVADNELAENSENWQGREAVTVKIESQNRLGRPKSSRIWGNRSRVGSVVPKTSEPDKKPTERELAVPEGVSDPAVPDGVSDPAVPDISPCPAAAEVPRRPLRGRKDPRKTVRQIQAVSLEKKLITEMCRWTKAKIFSQRGVDLVRERLEMAGLSSTPVFVLLIQVLRIDKGGCMQIIKEKMNKDAQSLAGKEQRADQLRPDPCSLQQVKDGTINVGNGQTMEVTQFKLGSAPPRNKPKTVLELLAEKRRAKACATTPASQSLAALAQLTAPPSKMPAAQVFQGSRQTCPPSPAQTSLPRRRPKPLGRSLIRQVACGKSVPSAPGQPTLGQHPPSNAPGATPQSNQIQPAVSSHTIAPPVKASVPRQLQPIAPMPVAPSVLQPSGVMVPLMLPNSTVPIMAMLTPKGLLYVPPGSITAVSNPISQLCAPASQAMPSSSQHTGTLTISMVPSGSPQSVATPVQVPALCFPSGSQAVADACISVPVQTTKAASKQPLTSPFPPLSAHVLTLATSSPLPGHGQLLTATSTNSNISAHLSQSGGASLPEGVPDTRCMGAGPSSLAQPAGTEPPPSNPQPDRHSVDFKLLSHEQDAVMKDWLQGKGGVQVPGMPTALPYLPPSSCTLRAFSKLLLHKRVLEQNLSGLGVPEGTDPGERLEGARTLVADRLHNNPAYQLLKSRFLSTFTLPAFLATLPPRGARTTIGPLTGDPDQDSEDGIECTDVDGESEDSTGESRLHSFPGEAVVNEEVTDEVVDSVCNQPFGASVTDLSFGCDLPASLETIEDQPAPTPPAAPKNETGVVTRWSLRPRKKH
ncbi:snRNA-activating protein complex subunit 4 isoform X2 [Mustelus asterias]